MSTYVKALAALSALMVAASLAAPMASADGGDDPCELAATFLCRFLPIAPELDGDVDLSKQLPPADGPTVAVEPQIPADQCTPRCPQQ
jgi:hypothetical protein